MRSPYSLHQQLFGAALCALLSGNLYALNPNTYLASNGFIAAAPTQQQAQDSYHSARQSFQLQQELLMSNQPLDIQVNPQLQDVPQVEKTRQYTQPENIALEDVELVLDVENITLKEVVKRITQQAEPYSGPWQVKWRLQPENTNLMNERVNLTAQAKFGEFVSLLTEKVKNLTGTQLFVTAFNGSRVLLVTDSYY